MRQWIEIGSVAQVPPLGARVVTTPKGDIAVFRASDDRLFALQNRCPHKAGPLSEGIVHGHHVTCPLHNWVIELSTGEAVAPDLGCAPVVPLKVVDGVIWLELELGLRVVHG